LSKDPEEVMPPPKAHKELSPAQAQLIGKWIEQGAPWQPHWSFIAPQRPELPVVSDVSWARNPIDRFVLQVLEHNGLRPAAEADRRTLARRVFLDLIGLPPTPGEVEAFVNDKSPGAYEKLVDSLLASPRYGEHRAHYWLDAARYGNAD
jgi:hypothetical protein